VACAQPKADQPQVCVALPCAWQLLSLLQCQAEVVRPLLCKG
jgi:hypothetical protein